MVKLFLAFFSILCLLGCGTLTSAAVLYLIMFLSEIVWTHRAEFRDRISFIDTPPQELNNCTSYIDTLNEEETRYYTIAKEIINKSLERNK